MDDIFKIIIWLVIIYSFVKPFIKKKEPVKPPASTGTKPQNNSQYKTEQVEPDLSVAAKKQDEYDILRELENMFKGNLKVPEQPKPTPVSDSSLYKSHEIKDKDLDLVEDKRLKRNIEDRTPIGSRQTYDEKMANRKVRPDQQRQTGIVDQKIDESARRFESVLTGQQKQRSVLSQFNRKLKNPATVRDMIIFSEILGKPKALRR